MDYISAYACLGGCVGGSLVVENPYVAQDRLIHLSKKFGIEPKADRSEVRKLLDEGYFDLEREPQPMPPKPLSSNLTRAITKMKRKEELISALPGLDCGLCGAPTCRDFADDVVREEAELTDCVFAADTVVKDLSALYGIRIDTSKAQGDEKECD